MLYPLCAFICSSSKKNQLLNNNKNSKKSNISTTHLKRIIIK